MTIPVLRFARLTLRRLTNRMGLTLLSLLSVTLAVGMVVSIPVFSQGVSYLLLQDELATLGRSVNRPPLTTRFYFITQRNQSLSLDDALDLGGYFFNLVTNQIGLPLAHATTFISSPDLSIQPLPGDTRYTEPQDGLIANNMRLAVMTGVEAHMEMVDGQPFQQAGQTGAERLPVWAYARTGDEMGFNAGEDLDMLIVSTGEIIPVTIVGLWQEADIGDFYWSGTSIPWRQMFLVTEADYKRTVEPAFTRKTGLTAWYMNPDADAMTLAQADKVAEGLRLLPSLADRHYPGVRMDVSPSMPLERYLQRRDSLSALLVGFSLPVLGLLLYFMWMLSGVAAQFQREEAAILASRGVSRRFLASLSLAETLLLIGAGTPAGLGAGYLMVRAMGLTSNFLVFGRRTPFPATLGEVDLRLLALALLLLALARLLPTMNAARGGIVRHLRQRARPRALSISAQLLADSLLVILTWYAYQQLDQRGSLGIIGWEPSGDPFRDPLLLLTPSLFVLTGGLVLTHLFPLVVAPMDGIGTRLKSFAAYMGLHQLRRQGDQYISPLFLSMVCLSLGAFYASMSLSLDEWLQDRIYYQVGADYRFQQGVPPPAMGGPMATEEANPEVVNAWLLPIGDYVKLPQVEAATRIGIFDAEVASSGEDTGLYLAIDRLDFPNVAFYRDDFSRAALGELLNRLGMYPNGILVSSRFLGRNRFVEGQRLTLELEFNFESFEHEFLIVGVYDYFPTVYPADTEVFVGNLDYLFEQTGDATLHQVWMKTAPGADPEMIVEQLVEMGIWPVQKEDAGALLTLDEERVERIGLYGVLSVGFLASALVASLGLLVYTYASLQGRLQQISVLRAVGVKTRLVLAMVAVEYGGVILYAVIAGTAIGVATSYLFVPFFRVSGDPVFALPPFVRHIAWTQIGWLTATFTITLILSQGIILYWATRREVFQVLRMGQRE